MSRMKNIDKELCDSIIEDEIKSTRNMSQRAREFTTHAEQDSTCKGHIMYIIRDNRKLGKQND